MVRRPSLAMDITFYDEQYPAAEQMKRSLTLDLESVKSPLKRARLGGLPVLSSPDLGLLKLTTPDLERLIAANSLATTGTPTPGLGAAPYAAPTEEQEMYVRGFVEALNDLHNSDSSQGQVVYADLDGPPVKDEPQTVPSAAVSPPMSPIDMECQEKAKLERKRQRNRVAASKCRRRKLERISRLEEKVKLLKGENSDLGVLVLRLKEHVSRLKEQVLEHVHGGCQISDPQF